MSDQQSWAEALNIKPESLAQWSSQAPAGTPLLVYCLEHGHVPLAEYWAWAQDHFGLAVLQSHYFQQAFDPSFLEQARLSGNWHPWCFPIEQWDDVTFVACVEPQDRSQDKSQYNDENSRVRYVLADPRLMREAWGATSTNIKTPSIGSSPAAIKRVRDAFGLKRCP
ncbi:MAG: hypothetical protein HC883_05655 [Bdellovibrionaceae bacterium]|nr:hypothetical protein [Pseudobdellovibrionaceae bacterium]